MIEHVNIVNTDGSINIDELNRANDFLYDYINGRIQVQRNTNMTAYELPLPSHYPAGAFHCLKYLKDNITSTERIIIKREYDKLKSILRNAVKGIFSPYLVDPDTLSVHNNPNITVASITSPSGIVEYYEPESNQTLWLGQPGYKPVIPFREHPKSEACATDIWLHYGFANDPLLNRPLSGIPEQDYYEDPRLPYPIINTNYIELSDPQLVKNYIESSGYCNGFWSGEVNTILNSLRPLRQIRTKPPNNSYYDSLDPAEYIDHTTIIPTATPSIYEKFGRHTAKRPIKVLKFPGDYIR